MIIRPATAADSTAINDIYSYEVLNGVATFDTEPRTPLAAAQWLAAHDAQHPVLVAQEGGRIVGWASMSLYSERKAWAGTAEDSLYVHPEWRGHGIGKALFAAILDAGRTAGLHTVLARITAVNRQSIDMHTKAGFEQMGILREAGVKFGRLLDVVYMQLIYR